MERLIVIMTLIILPSMSFAAVGPTFSASMTGTMTVYTAITVATTNLVLPAQIANTTPSSIDSTGSSVITGGTNGTHGQIRLSGGFTTGVAVGTCPNITIINGSSSYTVTTSSIGSPVTLSGGVGTITVRGSFVPGTALVVGGYTGSSNCTVQYN